jgi:hypothetical protein
MLMIDTEDGCAGRTGEGEIVGPYFREHCGTRAVSVKQLVYASTDWSNYAADLSMMHRLRTRNPRNAAEGVCGWGA